MRFTQKQMKVLSQYEYQLKTAYKGNWVSCMPSSAVMEIHDILRDAYGIDLRTKPYCGGCVLELMKFTGERYFRQKEEALAPKPKKPTTRKVKNICK